MSIKGFLPSQCGKSGVAAFEAWPETHSIAATLQLHEIVSLYISCALLCFLWIFKTHWWCCEYVALSNKRGKQGFDSTPPVQFVTHNIREREASESCPFWAVLIYLSVCVRTRSCGWNVIAHTRVCVITSSRCHTTLLDYVSLTQWSTLSKC